MDKKVMREITIHTCYVCGKEHGDNDGWMVCNGCGKYVCPSHNKGFLTFEPHSQTYTHLYYLLESHVYSTRLCPECLGSKDKRKFDMTNAIYNLMEIEKQLEPIYKKADEFRKTLNGLRDKR